MNFPLIQDILIILAFSVLVVFLLQRLHLPSILGFLITGIIIGPSGLGLISAVHEVELIAEIGVILLLFVIGMELSLKELASLRKTVLVGGLLQVGLAIGISAAFSRIVGFSWNESVFLGFLLALSSTAIVLKILQDRNEISAPHGRNALGILIFQDIIVIPMILVTPILAGETSNVTYTLLELLGKSLLIILITLVSARYIVPYLLHFVAKTNSKELFLLTTLMICFAVTWITAETGLSLALGAFLAGLIISESRYSHQATSLILPFKELFTSFFFISIGMLLNLAFFMHHAGLVLLIALGVFVLKGTIGTFAAAVLRYPPRTALLTGLALFQIGEFAFILSRVGVENGLLSQQMNQYFLSVSIITMLLTPFVMMFSEKLAAVLIPQTIQKRWGMYLARGKKPPRQEASRLENHLVIIGYGLNGHNVAQAAKYIQIPYVILEMNAETVRQEKAKGEHILFGDASQLHMLETVRLNKARVVVIAISDPTATKYIVSNIRNICQSVYVIVRTRYINETEELLSLGADEVIPEEFETSLAIFSRVLQNFLVPVDEIEKLVRSIRSDNYNLLQAQPKMPKMIKPTPIPNFKVTCVRLEADGGKLAGKTIQQANIRKNYGVNILAINRNERMIYPISPENKLQQNDLIYVSGNPEHIEAFYKAAK
ncbi:MAG: cation:proton antiporter [Bacteroidales bacterium]|nr:cation:proton antiporter [Bacteroidales bacterium]